MRSDSNCFFEKDAKLHLFKGSYGGDENLLQYVISLRVLDVLYYRDETIKFKKIQTTYTSTYSL